ncbi:RNA-binding S4 domain-containing protein [Pseudaquabacterium rugosum]|jgi:ribosome-associated heat shock protein Hsp15|uniref:RNA-binding S4 domain-containing protein n=1 Tax=Pseudaquabacterium rugosum TaxID=2984194 RepID=A0ABU9BEA4_9BURK
MTGPSKTRRPDHRTPDDTPAGVRLDKWLWAARFFKTRSLAADEIDKGRISINGQAAKASREPRPGDQIELRQPGGPARTVRVRALSAVRGPAPVAQMLYEETAESLLARTQAAEARRLAAEPALAIAHGRPTKRDRREITRSQHDWQRWSASIDDARPPGDD